MKNIVIFVIAVLLTAGGSYLVSAQQQESETQNQWNYQVNLMTAQSLIQRQIVTPSDGGVIILVGDKLLKYDNNLNLLREVEFNPDLQRTYENIYKLMQNCPACKLN